MWNPFNANRKPREYPQYLVAPAAYWQATPAQKALICNGAGPDRYAWLVPDTIYGLRITEAANIHDWMYVFGETEQEKENADTTFLLNLFRIINEHTTTVPLAGWCMRWLRHRRAVAYYEAVCDFGHGAYKTARRARPRDTGNDMAGLPPQA